MASPPGYVRIILIGLWIILAITAAFLLYYGTKDVQSQLEFLNDLLLEPPTCILQTDCIHGICFAGQCFCDIEYTGEDCNTTAFICSTENDPEICNNGVCYLGKCICEIGWQGDFCNITADLCISSNDSGIVCFEDACCNYPNGECWFGKCICTDGWYGELCEFHSCLNETQFNNCTLDSECKHGLIDSGDCYEGRCFCLPNYIGFNCQLQRRDLSFCDEASDCLNGGECHDNSQGNGECYCLSTTTGYNCES